MSIWLPFWRLSCCRFGARKTTPKPRLKELLAERQEKATPAHLGSPIFLSARGFELMLALS
jgi:hypothetical protein